MARYWVGGTGNTSDATNHWATTSGGAPGAGNTPTAADDLFFDASSGTGTVTINAALTGRSLQTVASTLKTCTHNAFTVTLGDATAGSGAIALDLSGFTTYTALTTTAAITLVSTAATQQTIKTNGFTLGTVTAGNAGSSYLQVGDLTTIGNITITSTTYDTTTNSVKMTLSGAAGTFAVGSKTVYEIDFTGSGTQVYNSSGTCTNFKRIGTAAKTDTLNMAGGVTVTGALTLQGNSAANRVLIYSNAIGTQRMFTTTGATVTATNTDFQDIKLSVTKDLSAQTDIGDGGGNAGITFPAPATQTCTMSTNQNWSTAGIWTSRIPLPQDNVLLSGVTGGTLTADMPRLGASIDWTGATGSPLWGSSAAAPTPIFCGSLTLAAGMGFTGTPIVLWAQGRGSSTLTTAGVSVAWGVTLNAPGGTLTQHDDFTCSLTGSRCQILVGTWTTNNYNYTCTQTGSAPFLISGASAVLNMGSSTFTLNASGAAGNAVWQVASGTINCGTSTIVIVGATGTSRTFSGGGKTYYNLQYTVASSPGPLVITGANTFHAVQIGAGRAVQMATGTTQTITGALTATGVPTSYVYLPGASGNYISTPNAAALQITGDITIDAQVALASWLPSTIQTLVAKEGSATSVSYLLYVDTAGKLTMQTSVAGTTLVTSVSTVATGVSAGTTTWVRASLRVNDGAGHNVCQFYTSSDGATWTQLGTTLTNAGATSIYSSTDPLEVGSMRGGTTNLMTGNVYEVKLYNAYLQAASGTPVFDATLTAKAFGANSFTESSPNAATVTINGLAAQAGDGRVALASTSAGTQGTLSSSMQQSNDYLVIQDSKVDVSPRWYAGTHSVNTSNTTNWIFTDPVAYIPTGGTMTTLGIA